MARGTTSIPVAAYKTGVGELGGQIPVPINTAFVGLFAKTEIITEGAFAIFAVARTGLVTIPCAVELELIQPVGGQPGFEDDSTVTVNIPAGVVEVQVPLETVNSSSVIDGDRVVEVKFGGTVGCTPLPNESHADVTIQDAVAATLSIAPESANVVEPDTGNVMVRFHVTRAGDISSVCSCRWVRSGTIADADLTSPTSQGLINFTDSETGKRVDFFVVADALIEKDPYEFITVTIDQPVNCIIPSATSSATTTIEDHDVVSLAILTADANPVTVVEGSSGSKHVDFIINRGGPTTDAVTVDWSVAWGPGINDNDFVTGVGSETQNPGWPYRTTNLYQQLTFSGINRYGEGGDQWPVSEQANSDLLFVPADGNGWLGNKTKTEFRLIRVSGNPPSGLTGVDLAGMPEGTDVKPQGILALSGNRVICYYSFDTSSTGTKMGHTHCGISLDGGATFDWNDEASAYIFAEGSGEDVMVWGVLQLDKGYTAGASGIDTDYVYVYLTNTKQQRVATYVSNHIPTTIWAARVKIAGTNGALTNVLDRSKYQLFTGMSGGIPQWSTLGATTGKAIVYQDNNGMTQYFNCGWHSAMGRFVVPYCHCSNTANSIPNQAIAVAISPSPFDSTQWRMLCYNKLAPTTSQETNWYLAISAPTKWNNGTDMYFGLSTYVETASGGNGDNLIVTKAVLARQLVFSGKASFAAGETQKLIGYDIAGDTTPESNEVLTMRLSNPQPSAKAALGTITESTITIIDDDTPTPAVLTVEASPLTITEGTTGGVNPITVTFKRSGNLTQQCTAYYTIGGTISPDDFVSFPTIPHIVTWPVGSTEQVGVFNIKGDTTLENDETAIWSLQTPSANATLGTPSSVTVTVLNDESTKASLTVFNTINNITEGDSGSKTITWKIMRGGDTAAVCSVNWQITGPAANSTDLVSPVLTGTASFAASITEVLVSVQVRGDTTLESGDSVKLSLISPANNADIGVPWEWTVTIVDDDDPVAGSTPIRRVPAGKNFITSNDTSFSGPFAAFAQIKNIFYQLAYYNDPRKGELRRTDGTFLKKTCDHSVQGVKDHARYWVEFLKSRQARYPAGQVKNGMEFDWESDVFDESLPQPWCNIHQSVPPSVTNAGWVQCPGNVHRSDRTSFQNTCVFITTYDEAVQYPAFSAEAVRWQAETYKACYAEAKAQGINNLDIVGYQMPERRRPPGTATMKPQADAWKVALCDSGLMSAVTPNCYWSTGYGISTLNGYMDWHIATLDNTRANFPGMKILAICWARWNGNPDGSDLVPAGWMTRLMNDLLDWGVDGFWFWRSSADANVNGGAGFSTRYEEVVDVIKARGTFVLPV